MSTSSLYKIRSKGTGAWFFRPPGPPGASGRPGSRARGRAARSSLEPGLGTQHGSLWPESDPARVSGTRAVQVNLGLGRLLAADWCLRTPRPAGTSARGGWATKRANRERSMRRPRQTNSPTRSPIGGWVPAVSIPRCRSRRVLVQATGSGEPPDSPAAKCRTGCLSVVRTGWWPGLLCLPGAPAARAVRVLSFSLLLSQFQSSINVCVCVSLCLSEAILLE